jgi:hypothetical protein
VTLDDLQRAKNLESCINAANRNLEGYKKLEEAKEIKIQTNDKNTEEVTLFFSGEIKNKITNLLKEKEERWINEKLEELYKI